MLASRHIAQRLDWPLNSAAGRFGDRLENLVKSST
jgi:hypothetical protein